MPGWPEGAESESMGRWESADGVDGGSTLMCTPDKSL